MSAAQPQSSSAVLAKAAAGFGEAALLSGLVGLGLYGVFCVLFCATLYVMYTRRQTTGFNSLLLAASVTIFVLSSLDAVLKSRRLTIAFLYTPSPYTPDEYIYGTYDWTYTLEDAAIVLNMLTADAVLIYRAWIVWGQRWKFVVVNAVLWLILLATTVRTLQLQVTAISNPDNAALMLNLNIWALATELLSLLQTVTATSIIATRLWLVDRAVSRYKQGSLLPVIRIVVESGAIYSLLLLVYVPLSITTGPTVELLVQLVSPTIGITFSLIIVRVGLDLTGENRTTTRTSGENSDRSQPVNISIRRDVESIAEDQVVEISGTEEEKDSFAMKRRDSVSSQRL